jgi:hypothetical protein
LKIERSNGREKKEKKTIVKLINQAIMLILYL